MLNADDPCVDVWRVAARERTGVRVIDLRARPSCRDPPAARARRSQVGRSRFRHPGARRRVQLAVPGRHMVRNALAAAAAALAVGVPLAAIVRGLEAFRPGRRPPRGTAVWRRRHRDRRHVQRESGFARAAIDVLAALPSRTLDGDWATWVKSARWARAFIARSGNTRATRHRPAADDRRARGRERCGVRNRRAALRVRRGARGACCGDRAGRNVPYSSRARASCGWNASSRHWAARRPMERTDAALADGGARARTSARSTSSVTSRCARCWRA